MTLKDFKTTKERREYIEKTLKIKLEKIAQIETDEENIHCENLIGSTTLPLGVAGSLKIQNSEFKIQNYFIPLATTEGALVASVSRGCKAINLSGGSTSYVEEVGGHSWPSFL